MTAPGATFLDHRLVERQAMPLAMSGFGQEVREAMDARARHLAAQGLARYEGSAVVPQQGLPGRLRGRELAAAGAALAAETHADLGAVRHDRQRPRLHPLRVVTWRV